VEEQIKINWYRCKVDKAVMRELMRPSDLRGLAQAVPQLLLYFTTTALCYAAFLQIHLNTWPWALPLLLLALFIHGTTGGFMGLVAVHELGHKTPFKSKKLNEFFTCLFSFISWSDYVAFRPSHVKHHQATTHHDHDGEVVLPQTLDWKCVKFFITMLTFDPVSVFKQQRAWWVCAMTGKIITSNFNGDWLNKVMPESNRELHREHQRWARIVVGGHLALAALFIATGHWFLIIPFQFGVYMSPWLVMLCGMPQHIGLSPDTPDFRLCCRTYTCSWLPAFLYWNMQYHVEHHMFPSVPFYNLPKLRKAIEHDLPPAPHGLWATWKELLPIIQKQKENPSYVFVPPLPRSAAAVQPAPVAPANALPA